MLMKCRYEGPPFAAEDEVILAHQSYQGTPGVFVGLPESPRAGILEQNGKVRSHPLVWLAYSQAVGRPWTAKPAHVIAAMAG